MENQFFFSSYRLLQVFDILKVPFSFYLIYHFGVLDGQHTSKATILSSSFILLYVKVGVKIDIGCVVRILYGTVKDYLRNDLSKC